MADKFGAYINTLMTTVIDKEQEEFVKKLAWDELKRLNQNIEEFLRKNAEDDVNKSENTVKQLLQEDNKDV